MTVRLMTKSAIGCRTVLALGLLLVVAGAFVAAGARAAVSETLYLDSYSTLNAGSSSTQSALVLADGQHYTVTVKGTFSAWRGWAAYRCGKVAPAPIYRSPGRPDDPTGWDAEFKFAYPAYGKATCDKASLPKRASVFQVNSGSGWSHPSAVGGPFGKPKKSHTYRYDVVGQDQPLGLRIVDNETRDNNGRFRVQIAPAP